MSDFKERLIAEKAELDAKREKLDAFISGEKIKTIDPVQATLLRIQYAAMTTYLQCLLQRIVWLEQQVAEIH